MAIIMFTAFTCSALLMMKNGNRRKYKAWDRSRKMSAPAYRER